MTFKNTTSCKYLIKLMNPELKLDYSMHKMNNFLWRKCSQNWNLYEHLNILLTPHFLGLAVPMRWRWTQERVGNWSLLQNWRKSPDDHQMHTQESHLSKSHWPASEDVGQGDILWLSQPTHTLNYGILNLFRQSLKLKRLTQQQQCWTQTIPMCHLVGKQRMPVMRELGKCVSSLLTYHSRGQGAHFKEAHCIRKLLAEGARVVACSTPSVHHPTLPTGGCSSGGLQQGQVLCGIQGREQPSLAVYTSSQQQEDPQNHCNVHGWVEVRAKGKKREKYIAGVARAIICTIIIHATAQNGTLAFFSCICSYVFKMQKTEAMKLQTWAYLWFPASSMTTCLLLDNRSPCKIKNTRM